MFHLRRFIDNVAQVANGDYSAGFKMLGFVLYVREFGTDDLLSGAMVSPRTFYRWVETVKAAGWESLLTDVRFGQALREYISKTNGQPSQIRKSILERVNEVLN